MNCRPRQARASRSSSHRVRPWWQPTGNSRNVIYVGDVSTNPPGARAMSTTTAPATLTGIYALDPTHSRIGFVARHAMVTKVRGSFNEFDGSGYFDADDPSASNLQLTIQAASIDTRNADRDAHLRGNDFFDMENHPEITFVSHRVERVTTTTTGSPATSRSRASPSPSPSTSSTSAPPSTRTATTARARRQGHRQPQGLGRELERRARSRRRAGQREGHPRVRGVRHQGRRLTQGHRASRARGVHEPGVVPPPPRTRPLSFTSRW